MTKTEAPPAAPDFSLVLGGPLYQMFVRSHLSGTTLELLRRRVVVFAAITWLPLLLLSAVTGALYQGSRLPFLVDFETHVRFLVALPLLIYGELIVHTRLRGVVESFITRSIVIPEELSKFRAAIASSMKLRNSVIVEIGLLILAYSLGHWIWRNELALGTATWYAATDGANLSVTLPGYWYEFVSIPLAQFILLRWYFRIINWTWLLWRFSRLKLKLRPTHPDRAGGLGFLGRSTYAFVPILFAQGALLSGVIANRILYQGASLLSFKMTIATLVGFLVVVNLGPLLFFIPALAQAKRRGLSEYGALAATYSEDFDNKWVKGGNKDEALLGTSDIQSLADLGNSYAVVREMQVVPFNRNDVILLVVATVIPLLPLLLTVIPLDALLKHIVTAIL